MKIKKDKTITMEDLLVKVQNLIIYIYFFMKEN
jgi:hypothetical protein